MSSSWSQVQLGDLAQLVGGVSYRSAELTDSPLARPLINLKCFSRGGGYRPSGLKYFTGQPKADQLVDDGDVLIALTDLTQAADVIGSPIRVSKDLANASATFSSDLAKLVVDQSLADSQFLAYALMAPSVRSYMAASSTGTTVLHLSKARALTAPITLPCLQEQRLIAEILGTLDELALDEEAQRARFADLGFSVHRTIMNKAQARHDTSHNSAVTWTTIGEVACVVEAGRRPSGGVGHFAHGVPSIGAESVDGLGVFDFSKVKYVPSEWAAKMKQGVLASRDVLIYKDGGRPGEYIPHVGMFGDGFPFEHMTINEHVFRLRGNDEVSQEWLFFWLASPEGLRLLADSGTGAAIPGINASAFKAIPVPIPSKEDRAKVYADLEGLVTGALSAARTAASTRAARDELLPLLMSGRIRVGGVAA